MELGERGLDLLREHEGLRLEAYQDSAGVWTIGYGHTGDVQPGDRITEERATELLREDVAWAEQAVRDLVEVELSQTQFDALVAFAFNVGRSALANSDLLGAVNARDHTSVAMEFPRWRRAGGRKLLGLSRRRIAEAALYLDAVLHA